jgi:hypothetical protein
MVPGSGFWQNQGAMQNASEAGAETAISAQSSRKNPPVSADGPVPASAGDPSPGHVAAASAAPAPHLPVEIGGPPGPEPTRYGDWEKKGRCIDF